MKCQRASSSVSTTTRGWGICDIPHVVDDVVDHVVRVGVGGGGSIDACFAFAHARDADAGRMRIALVRIRVFIASTFRFLYRSG